MQNALALHADFNSIKVQLKQGSGKGVCKDYG